MTSLVMYTKACIRAGVKGQWRSRRKGRSAREKGEVRVVGINVSDQSLGAGELEDLDREFEIAPPSRVLRWALDTFGDGLVLAASFEDIVLIDLATKIAPGIEVVFLDTEAHFPETLAFVDEVRLRYGLNLTVTRPGPEAAAHPCGSAQCCQFRKVEPLRRALEGKTAWLTSLKRADGPSRADAPIVSWDDTFGLVKVNPLATWTAQDIVTYLADHGLPAHPLVARGYLSIGCAPTTRPVIDGEDARAGRWAGLDKSECGLHV
jgi:phosphoadenosine phosphosulfate reductase